MAYNPADPTDRQALNTEVFTDPLSVTNPPGMGYDPEDDRNVITRLNTPALNVGGDTNGEEFTPLLAFQSTVPTDLDVAGISDGRQKYLELAMSFPPETNLDSEKATFIAALPPGSQTEATINAKIALLSRAEVLFGRYTEISQIEWQAARDNPGVR